MKSGVKMKMLVVEDDFISRQVLTKMLSKYGVCDVAVDGEEAIEAVQRSIDDNEMYDVIFLDIMMPKKNGQEVLQEIREYEEKNDIFGLDGVKIIMVTALGDNKNIINAFKAQCEGYIIKPIDHQKVLDKLEEVMED